ncbi:hypothetical protein [Sorangium sp. So ce542]|uniref:hypothetical protein n=1 Tax=Sorangium sp. So ce542 TaxID=3133316 RepID=UPI003F634872
MVERTIRQHLGGEETAEPEQLMQAVRMCEEASPHHWWMRGETARADPLHEIGSNILDLVGKQSSGSITSVASHLRTLAYWRISEHLGIPFCPSIRRVPALDGLRASIHRNAHDTVYRAVAKAFQAEVAEVYDDAEEQPIALPPCATLFLNALREERDIAAAIALLRERFAPLRRQLANIQVTLSQGSIGARRKAKQQVQAALSALAVDADEAAKSMVREALALVPDVLNVVSSADPAKFSVSLIEKPASWIRGWWVRRPLHLAFDVRRRAVAVERYPSLLRETTGVDLSKQEIEYFTNCYAKASRLFLG